eukprot:CAMPEP_0181321252 /NCGR_PEP_ID=MMETSP1101-20121128/18576_1 /TAXON_ID=46948 /ORGANISM="Rhodomonas abbreviata, Strain Caron Lab Isolate" /LENGTH=111 /DNA_ID=CAMNT_0023429047 /DNA_START=1111 /DNA_END=1446 /DNA_ORIENTATION=+
MIASVLEAPGWHHALCDVSMSACVQAQGAGRDSSPAHEYTRNRFHCHQTKNRHRQHQCLLLHLEQIGGGSREGVEGAPAALGRGAESVAAAAAAVLDSSSGAIPEMPASRR